MKKLHLMETLTMLKKYLNYEVSVVLLFMAISLLVNSNKMYLFVILIYLIILTLLNRDFLSSLWILFLSILPFGVGKGFIAIVMPGGEFAGREFLGFNLLVKFSDLILVFIIYLLLKDGFEGKPNKHHIPSSQITLLLFLTFFLIFAFISTYYSSFFTTSFFYYLQLLRGVIIFTLSNIFLKKGNVLKRSFDVFIAFCLINGILTIFEYFKGTSFGFFIEDRSRLVFAKENFDFYRPGGIYSDPNTAATFFGSMLPLIFTNALVKGRMKSFYKFVFIVTLIAIIFTGSRTVWVVSFISLLVVYKKFGGQMKNYFRKFLFSQSKIIWLFALIILGPIIFARTITLKDIFQENGGGTFRINHFKIAKDVIVNNPLGIGLGVTPYFIAEKYPFDKTGIRADHLHSFLAQIGAETGLLGLTLFIIFLYLVFKEKMGTVLSKNPFFYGIFVSFCAYVAISLFFPWFLHEKIFDLFWLLAAV